MPAVPEGNELFDYPILAAEHGVGGASDIMEAEKQAQKAPGAFYTNPRTGQRAPVSILPPEAQRQEEAGTAEVLQGVGEASTPLVAASGLQAPIGLARSLATGYVAGKGAKYVTKKAGGSPEAQAEAEAVGFFLPSAAEVLSGLKTGSIQTPEGKFSAASAFGGRVRGGVATTPEAFDIRGQVGGTTVGVRIPRGGAPVPETPPDFTGMRTGSLPNRFNPIVVHPEPSEAAKALLDFEQHSGNPEYQPPAPAPQPPQATGPDHLTPDIAKGITDVITRAPEAQRPNLIMEAHGNMVKWMMTKGTFTGPDGKIYTVENEGQAKKLANTFINGEIDKFDKAQQEAAKAAANKPAQAPTNGTGPTSKPAKALTRQPVKTAQPVPINHTPDIQHVPGPTGQPMGASMTKDSPAVKAVEQKADLAPGQVPDVMVKKEAPSNAAKLAQPPKEPKPENLAKIGTEDKESGRQIVQPSTSAIENERLAAEAAPELATHLSQIAAQVPGAKFDRMRPQKNIDRVGDKTEGGKPPETIQDYVAAQIAADSPEAKNKLLVELEKTGRVLSVEDKFLEPRKDLAGYASTNVQYQLSNGASAEVQIVPREIQEITDQSHHFYTEGRKAKERGDHAEAEKNFKEAARITGAALDRFKERNGLNEKPQHDFASTQINIDKNSELGQAHAAAVAGIPEQHIGKEGRESTPHVTVRYGLKNDSPETIQKIREAVGKIQPFEVPIGRNEVFPATEHSSYDHPVVARLQPTPELQALRSAVESAGGFKEDNFPEYKPHVTLAYIKPEFAQQYKGGNHLEGQKVPVDHIVVTKKNGSEEAIALGTAKTPDLVAEHEAGNVPDLVAEHEGKTYSGPERRTHLAERKRVEHMTHEEKDRELLTSRKTGLPNERAYEEDSETAMAQSHPHVGFADVDDFKEANTILGEDAVDEKVLPLLGELLRNAAAKEPTGSIKVYHRSGDEFWFRAKDKAAIGRIVERVNAELKDAIFTAEAPDGTIHEKRGAGLSYGTGTDTRSAEADEKYGTHAGSKKSRKEAGLRSGSRDLPERVGEKPAQGQQVARSGAAERQEVPAKGAEERPALSLEHPAPAFFSKAEKVAEEKLPKNVSAQSVIPTLKNAGVKEEELKWLGLDDWLKERKLVSKQEVLDHIRQNNVQVQEVEKSEKQLPEMRWLESKSGYGRPMWVTNVGRREFSITKVGDAHTGEEFTLYRTRHEGDEYIGHFDTLEEAQRIAQQEAAGKGHNAPKFSQYQLPGGSNYRELLLTLPPAKPTPSTTRFRIRITPSEYAASQGTTVHDEIATQPTIDNLRRHGHRIDVLGPAMVHNAEKDFTGGHFDEPNVLAHVRFNDRISPDGKKTLFIEEVQSDWHQMGRKQGYRSAISERELKQLEEKRLAAWREALPLVESADNLGYDSASQVSGDLASGALNPDYIDETGVPGLRAAARKYAEIAKEYREAKKQSEIGVPDAPFKTTWHELAMKRMLRYAAENGYDRIAWTTGEQQAARYDLSKHIDSLNWQKNPDGTYNISPLKNGEAVGNASMQRVAPDKLADVIGKEVAEKIINGHGQTWTDNKGTAQGELSNLDLKVGGSGMKGFYDKILPEFMNRYGKKWGAKVGETEIDTGERSAPLDAFKEWMAARGHSAHAAMEQHRTEGPLYREFQERGAHTPAHSIDITPSMKDSVLYEGQPLFNLSKPELQDWLKAAGPGRVKVEELGEQGGLFGGNDKMYRLFTSKQNSVAVTENQLKELGSAIPSFGRKLRERDIIADDAVSVDYHPPEPASLFGAQKPPVLIISRGARDLINQLTSFGQRFQGANISVGNARKIAAQLLDEPGVGARAQAELDDIPDDKKADARRIGEALRQAAQDAGNSGITIHKEGLPQHAVEEEAFHAGQRELGRGEVSRHLPVEAVDRIMEHPASAKLQKALKAQGYPENAPKEYQVSEMAAKIAVGQHDLHPNEAADWFIRYLDELHQEHGIGNVAAAFANLYDGARDYYERAREDLAARASRSGGRESGIQQAAGGVPEHPTGAAPPQTGRGNRQDQAGRQGSLDQPFLLSRDKSAAEPPALSLQDDVDYFLPSVAKQRDSEPASTAKPAPGTRSAHTGNETRLNEIQQLTDAIAQNKPHASLADRLKFARNKGGEDAGGGELNTIMGRIKGTFAALKSAMTNPPKFGDYEKATGEWSGADQRSALDLYRFTKALKEAVPEKLKRVAISNWIEAGGDDQVLQERADASNPKYKPGYEAALKLTDAEKTIAQNIMNLHDATLQEAIKAGIVEGGVENYIQHIYSNQPAMVNRIRAELNFNTLKTNPSFSKRRVLPTYFDAEQLGFEPKDKDVGYLTSVHERSLREALAARAYIKSLNQGKEDDGRPLLIASWASAKEVAGEDAEGNPLDPAYLIKPNLPRGEQYADYMTLDHPALRGWRWAAEIDGKPVFVKGDVLVHPAIYRKLKNNLGTSALRRYEITVGDKTVRPGDIALNAVGQVKHFVLSFSGFHQTTLAVHALEHKVNPAIPQEIANALVRHTVNRDFTAPGTLPKLDLNDPVQSDLVDHGLMVAHYDAMEAFGEGVASGGGVTKIPGIGPLYRNYVEYLFKDYMPRLKMQMAKAALERNRKRYPDLNKDQLYALTASQANAAFGGLNYRMLGRNKTFQDTLRLLLMAPDFTEARGRFAAQAGTKYGREQLMALMLGAAVMYTITRIINEMSDKDPHWAKPFAVVHDGKEYHLRTIQGDLLDAGGDLRRFLRNRVSPPVSFIFSDDKYRKKHESILDEIKSRGEGAVPIPVQPWMYESRDSNAEKAFDSVMKMIGINERKEQKHR